jgi:hypothetical protein
MAINHAVHDRHCVVSRSFALVEVYGAPRRHAPAPDPARCRCCRGSIGRPGRARGSYQRAQESDRAQLSVVAKFQPAFCREAYAARCHIPRSSNRGHQGRSGSCGGTTALRMVEEAGVRGARENPTMHCNMSRASGSARSVGFVRTSTVQPALWDVNRHWRLDRL